MDHTSRNIFWITATSFLLALEVLIIIVTISGFIPIETAPIAKGVVPQLLQLFKPEREINIYRLVIIIGIMIHGFLCFWWKKKITSENLSPLICPWVINAIFWISLQLFAAFKLLQYQNPVWAKVLFYATGLGFMATQIFWPEVRKWYSDIRHSQNDKIIPFIHLGMLIIIAFLLYIPGLNTIVNTQMIAAILYFWIMYLLLYVWFDGLLIAIFGTLLAIKLNLFHLGQYPICWAYPASTVLANIWDLPVLFLIWKHLQEKKEWFLTLAGICCAIAVTSHLMAGMALTLAWFSYIVIYLLREKFKTTILLQLRAWLVAYVIALGFCQWQWGVSGSLSQQWLLMKNGWDALPITSCLYMHQFFSFAIALIIPLMFVGVILWGASLFMISKVSPFSLFLIPVAIYGLGWYYVFLYRSMVTGYYAGILPLMVIILFLLKQILEILSPLWRRLSVIILMMASILFLLTNNMFMVYRNNAKTIFQSR